MTGSPPLDELKSRINLVCAINGQIDVIDCVQALEGNAKFGCQDFPLEGSCNTSDVAYIAAAELLRQSLNHQCRRGAGTQANHHAVLDLFNRSRSHGLLHTLLKIVNSQALPLKPSGVTVARGLPQARTSSGRHGASASARLKNLLDRRTEPGFLVGTSIAMHHAHLHSLVDLAEGGVEGRLNGSLGIRTRILAVAAAGDEAALHQGAQGRLVGAVAQTVALGDLDALLGRLVIGHSGFAANSTKVDPTTPLS